MVYHHPLHSEVATHSQGCIIETRSSMTVSVDTIYMDPKPSCVTALGCGVSHHAAIVSVIALH